MRKLASKRGRKIKKEAKEELNLLRLRQIYLNRKISIGQSWPLPNLKIIHRKINKWYENEYEKVKYQAIIIEYQESEKVQICHHELHKNRIKKSSILKLDTPDGRIEGHKGCADFLEQTLVSLLENQANLDSKS